MSSPLQKHSHSLRSKPPLLLTESQSEFDDLAARFRKEILPRGIVEQIYFDDIIASVWEILRLRRCKTVIVNIAFKKALHALLDPQLGSIMTVPKILPNDGSMTQPRGPRSLKFSANSNWMNPRSKQRQSEFPRQVSRVLIACWQPQSRGAAGRLEISRIVGPVSPKQ